jgi:hypothetical protein
MQRMLDSFQALYRVGEDEGHRLNKLMHDCTIDGVDYLTELTKWMSIVFRPLSCLGLLTQQRWRQSSARLGIRC